jgi:hypothetical protein
MRSTVIAAAAVLVALAGCGADEAVQPGTRPAPSKRTIVSKAAARKVAKAMLLERSDFPSGWAATRAKKNSVQAESCGEIDDLEDRFRLLADVESPTFSQAKVTRVQSGAAILKNERRAGKAMSFAAGVFKSRKAHRCFSDALAEGAEGVVSLGELSIRRRSFPRAAERSSAWRLVVPFETRGLSGRLYLDFVFMQDGQAVAFVFFSNVFEPFPKEDERRLVELVAGRMESAQR